MQPRGDAVVLGHGQPVPHRVFVYLVAPCVFLEIAQDMELDLAGIAAQVHQAGAQVVGGVRHAAIDEVRAEAADVGVPRAFVQLVVQLRPIIDANVFHSVLGGCPTLTGFGRVGLPDGMDANSSVEV